MRICVDHRCCRLCGPDDFHRPVESPKVQAFLDDFCGLDRPLLTSLCCAVSDGMARTPEQFDARDNRTYKDAVIKRVVSSRLQKFFDTGRTGLPYDLMYNGRVRLSLKVGKVVFERPKMQGCGFTTPRPIALTNPNSSKSSVVFAPGFDVLIAAQDSDTNTGQKCAIGFLTAARIMANADAWLKRTPDQWKLQVPMGAWNGVFLMRDIDTQSHRRQASKIWAKHHDTVMDRLATLC